MNQFIARVPVDIKRIEEPQKPAEEKLQKVLAHANPKKVLRLRH
jgi:hypothetical protein